MSTIESPSPGAGPDDRLLATRRQELILAEVGRRGSVRVRHLRDLVGVSEATIRRDLDALADRGLLQKVHGGATRLDPTVVRHTSEEPEFAAKRDRNLEQKQAIAAAAARRIVAGSSVGLTAGTTTWQLAHHLPQVDDLVVVTNSLPVVEVLHRRRPDVDVILVGGSPTPSDALVGPVADRALESLHVDHLFIGVHGMSARAGFTTPNMLEAGTDQAFIRAAESVVVLADSSKWGIVGLAHIAPLSSADTLVTDTDLPSDARATFAEAGAAVELV